MSRDTIGIRRGRGVAHAPRAFADALRRVPTLLLVALAALLAPSLAAAHASSDAFVSMTADGARIDVRWDIALRDLAALVDLDADGDGAIAAAEWRAAQPRSWPSRSARSTSRSMPRATARAASRRQRRRRGRLRARPASHALARRADATWSVLRFTMTCPRAAERVSVSYRLMHDVDATHRAIVDRGDGVPLRLRPGDPPTSIALDDARPNASFGRLRAPTASHHILDASTTSRSCLRWRSPRWPPPRATAPRCADRGRLVGLLTLFPVAHSITLAGSALGWLALPSRLVESAIAASVAFAGAQAFVAARAGRAGDAPSWLVFAFGLVHGFGFGSALLDAGSAAGPRCSRSSASTWVVEAGQLAVMALLFPAIWGLRSVRVWRRFVSRRRRAIVGRIAWFVAAGPSLDVARGRLAAAATH
jgi:hypothetical protein